jgi:hypothetical protein
MLAPERGVNNRLRFNIGAKVGNIREKAWQQVNTNMLLSFYSS